MDWIVWVIIAFAVAVVLGVWGTYLAAMAMTKQLTAIEFNQRVRHHQLMQQIRDPKTNYYVAGDYLPV